MFCSLLLQGNPSSFPSGRERKVKLVLQSRAFSLVQPPAAACLPWSKHFSSLFFGKRQLVGALLGWHLLFPAMERRERQEEVELEKSVRRLREKFYGKVDIPDAVVLMRQLCNNHDLACKRIIRRKDELGGAESRDELNNDPVALEIAEELNVLELTEENLRMFKNAKNNRIPPCDRQFACQPCDNMGWRHVPERKQEPPIVEEKIKEIAEELKGLELTEENVRMFNDAKNNQIPPCDRLFACQPCDNMWWRRVPERKQVSRCRKCGCRYDPVPLDQMWGIGEFQCILCVRTFRGWARMGSSSPCNGCRTPVFPVSIIRPLRTQGPRNRQQHSCFAEDCYNRREPHVRGAHCMHPQSRRRRHLPKVIFPSQEHDSTGSTVATCISQGSLMEDIDDLILEDLNEEDEGEDGENNG